MTLPGHASTAPGQEVMRNSVDIKQLKMDPQPGRELVKNGTKIALEPCMIVAGLILYGVLVSVFVLSIAAAAKRSAPEMEMDQTKLVPMPALQPKADGEAPLKRAA